MSRANRKPIGNFLIKRSLQTKIALQIFFVMVMTGLLTSLFLAWFYTYKSHEGTFYFMSNSIKQDLELSSFLGVILPSLITAQLVSFLIALAIGLFSSRKVAVPIYKVEKWADEVKQGNLTAKLFFREKDEMNELTTRCNAVVDFYRTTFLEIDAAVKKLESAPGDAAAVRVNVELARKALGKIAL